MSEEDLQLLITLDDPAGAPEEDIFNHLQAKNNIEYSLGQQSPAWSGLDQQAEAVNDNDAFRVTFGQGDWTCTLSRLTGMSNDSTKGMNIDVCTVAHWKNGEILEQKVFYDLVGMQKQIGAM